MSLTEKFDFNKIYEAIQNCRQENGKRASGKVGSYYSGRDCSYYNFNKLSQFK